MSRVQYGSNRDSYWQRGCDDSKAGKPETWPTNGGGFDRPNVGYANGYRYGLLNAGGEAGEMPRNVTAAEDRFLRAAVKRSGTLVATGKLAPKVEAGEMEAAKGDERGL